MTPVTHPLLHLPSKIEACRESLTSPDRSEGLFSMYLLQAKEEDPMMGDSWKKYANP